MSKDVQFANPETTLKDAASTMKTRDIGSMPVCEGRRVVGVITDRDIAIRGVAEGRDPGSTRVREVMSKEIVSVREDSDLKEAEGLMQKRQLRRLPVLNGQGELVGYLAMAKIARTENAETCGQVLQGVSQPSKTH
jgi:CBS domain-containing protein